MSSLTITPLKSLDISLIVPHCNLPTKHSTPVGTKNIDKNNKILIKPKTYPIIHAHEQSLQQ